MLGEYRIIEFQEPDIYYNYISNKLTSTIILITSCSMLAIISLSINYLDERSSIFTIIGQIIGFVFILLLSKFADKRDENADKISIILLLLPIITAIISANIFLSLNLSKFLTGLIPSMILFNLWSILPISMSFINKKFENHFELTVIINKFHKNVIKTYVIPYNSKLIIQYTKMWYVNNSTSYHRLIVRPNLPNSNIPINIPIAPLNIRGIKLLSLVLKLFPKNIILESYDLGGNFGGFLSVLAPKLKGVRFDSYSRTKDNSIELEEKCNNYNLLNDSNFVDENISKKSLIPRRKLFLLVLLIIWGITYQIISILYLIFFGFITFVVSYKWGISFGLLSLVFELFLLIAIIYSFQKFILWPLGLIFGNFTAIIDKEEVIIYYKKFIRSPKYIFPVNLYPYLRTEQNFLYLELKSDSGVFYRLKIGQKQ